MRTRTVGISAGVLLAAALASYGLWRNRPKPGFDVFRFEQTLARDFESVEAVPLGDLARTRARLAAAAYGPPVGLDAASLRVETIRPYAVSQSDHDQLVTLLSEWLEALATGDPAVYASWAARRGYRLDTGAELAERSDRSLRFMAGHGVPEAASPRDRFELLFRASVAYRSGESWPAALSGAPASAKVRYLECKDMTDFASLFFRTNDERYRWLGFEVKSTRQHWLPPVALEDLYQQHGFVPIAMASLTYQGKTGKWSPTNVLLYQDPSTRRWHIRSVVVVNAPSTDGTIDY
jgi:hypothetical protein